MATPLLHYPEEYISSCWYFGCSSMRSWDQWMSGMVKSNDKLNRWVFSPAQQSLHSLPIQMYFPVTPWALFCFPLKLHMCKPQGSKGFWGCKSSSLSIPPQLSVCVCVVFKSKAGRCQAAFFVYVLLQDTSQCPHTYTHSVFSRSCWHVIISVEAFSGI